MQQQSMAAINRRIGVALAWATGKLSRGQLWAVALSAVCLMTLIQGQALGSLVPLPANKVNWTYDYNPDVTIGSHYDYLPNSGATPSWSPYITAGSWQVQDNYLQIAKSAGTGNQLIWIQSTGWDSTGDMTVEFTMKIEDQTGSAAADMYFSRGPYSSKYDWTHLLFSTDSISFEGGPTVTGLDLTQWTTFRVTLTDWGTTPTTTVYLNNSIVPIVTLAGAYDTGSANVLDFGSIYPGVGGTVDWDVIRWTAGDLPPVVPEPSVMCLFGLGSVLLWWRRARK